MFPCDYGWTSFSFNSETVLLCQMCNAIAQGFMQPWIPALPPPTAPVTPSKDKSDKPDKAKGRQSGKGGTKGGPSKGSLQTVAVDPEATPDLKQALEVRRRWKYKRQLERKKNVFRTTDLSTFFSSTFDMDKLDKIHRLRWKEPSLKAICWKQTKIWLLRIAKFFRRLYGGGHKVSFPPPNKHL